LLVQEFADTEHAETYEGVQKQAQQDALARMRRFLKDAKASDTRGSSNHRHEVTGQSVEHPPMVDHGLVLQHMAGQHGLAISTAMRTSSRLALAAHAEDHKYNAGHEAL
jgi:hypothetical protein